MDSGKKDRIVRLPGAWFLPRDSDTMSLLRAQAETLRAAVVLADWPAGSPPTSTTVRDSA